MTNTQQLKELALRATGGKWQAFVNEKTNTFSIHTPDDDRHGNIVGWMGFDSVDCSKKQKAVNARFIAAANPAAIIELIERVEAAERELTRRAAAAADRERSLTEQVRALAAENAGLKKVPATDSETMLLALDAFNTHGSTRPDVGLQQAINVVMQRRETPATDAAIREIQAQAFDEFAAGWRGVEKVRERQHRPAKATKAGAIALMAEQHAARIRAGEQQ